MSNPDPAPVAGLKLNNVALAVGALPKAVQWYERVLGFTVAERGRFDAVGADFAMLDGAGLRVELVSRKGTVRQTADRTAPPDHLYVHGWKALVLETDDLPAATTALLAHEVDIVWADQPVSADRRSTMIRDCEGNLIHVFGPRIGVN
jgi:glyoxylase I family protein